MGYLTFLNRRRKRDSCRGGVAAARTLNQVAGQVAHHDTDRMPRLTLHEGLTPIH